MSNSRWHKGNRPTRMEEYLHQCRFNEAYELVMDWVANGLIIIPNDSDIDRLCEEMRDLMETGAAKKI